MNQFANYLQYHTQRVIPVYQNKHGSRSPSIKMEIPFNPSCSPNQKYIKQFKCLDQNRNQCQPNTFPIHRQSPNHKAPQITTKLRIMDKENSQNINNLTNNQPCITPRGCLKRNTSQNSSNMKQPTPQFENKYDYEGTQGTNQEFLLSNYEMNIRFVDSENHSRDDQQLLTIAEQLNRIDIKGKESQLSPKSVKSDEFLVQMDSVKKSDVSNTKTIGIQAFESSQFDKSELQLEKIFGSSFKKVKIIRKKQSQPTEQTQKTTEDESILKMDTQQDQNLKTLHNLSNIDFQLEQLHTQHSDLDSHRLRSHEDNELSNFRQIATPRQQHQKKISFLMYKKQLEKKN